MSAVIATSSWYEGSVVHVRHSPRRHEMRRRLIMPLVFLDELDDVLQRHRLWGRGPLHPVRYRRQDYFPHVATGDLDEAIRSEAREGLGRGPRGRLAVLTHLRTWGWCFNPLTSVYAVDAEAVDAQVLEVTSTPWKERSVHVIDARASGDGHTWEATFAKDLHVSPFLPMDLRYRLHATAPASTLSLRIEVLDPGGERVLDTRLAMRRGGVLDRPAMSRLVRAVPAMPLRVSWGIHVEAMRLLLKRVPIHRHPDRRPGAAHDDR